MANNFRTVNDYINSQSPETQKALLALKKIIRNAAPGVEELINYKIPAFALIKGGKRDKQIMIAGYKGFVGFYTGTNILKHFASRLSEYKVGKASIQFPTHKPLPEKLIIEIIQFKKNKLHKLYGQQHS